MKKKKMIYHTADNTLFDIKEAKYDFNLDKYKTEKRNYLIFSVIFSVLLICILLFLKNQVFLNLASALLGGSISIIIWNITSYHQDKMNEELSIIDLNLDEIDRELEGLRHSFTFYNPKTLERRTVESNDLEIMFFRIMSFADTAQSKYDIKEEFKLKIPDYVKSDFQDVTLNEYYEWCINFFNGKHRPPDEKGWDLFNRCLNDNYYSIERELQRLKSKLIRFKHYICCGNCPIDYRKTNV